jgi:hypothetical protein
MILFTSSFAGGFPYGEFVWGVCLKISLILNQKRNASVENYGVGLQKDKG